MKLNTLFLLCLLIWSCNEEKDLTKVSPCINSDGLIIVSTLKNVSGVVKKSDHSGHYLIHELEPNDFGNQLPLVPCNLPKDFELEGVSIKFSGKLMITEVWDYADYEAQPFEFTHIESIEGK